MKRSLTRIEKIKASSNDMIIASAFLYFIGCFYYGFYCLFLAFVAVGTSLIYDIAAAKIQHRVRDRYDFSSQATALLLTALLPATVPYWIPVLGVLVALAIVKYPFGGTGKYLMNPVAVAYAFLILNFSDLMLTYPVPFQKTGIVENVAITMASSPAAALKQSGVPSTAHMDMVLGNYAGPLGATCAIVLIVCGIYLIVRKAIDFRIPLVFLTTVAFIALMFPRLQVSRTESLFYELFSSSIIFCAVFLSSDYTVNPIKFSSKVVYGVLLGILTMMCQYVGAYEVGFPFAMIICDAMVPFIERIMPVSRFDPKYAEVRQL